MPVRRAVRKRGARVPAAEAHVSPDIHPLCPFAKTGTNKILFQFRPSPPTLASREKRTRYDSTSVSIQFSSPPHHTTRHVVGLIPWLSVWCVSAESSSTACPPLLLCLSTAARASRDGGYPELLLLRSTCRRRIPCLVWLQSARVLAGSWLWLPSSCRPSSAARLWFGR